MKPRLPILSLLLMAVFLLGGSIALVTKWPEGPAHIDWGVWLVVYFGYAFVVSASILHVLTGR